jgi:hypothetical protein
MSSKVLSPYVKQSSLTTILYLYPEDPVNPVYNFVRVRLCGSVANNSQNKILTISVKKTFISRRDFCLKYLRIFMISGKMFLIFQNLSFLSELIEPRA